MTAIKITPNIRIADMLCTERSPEPCGLVIFGASGDLAGRKLIPALFSLFRRRLLPDRFFLLGFARSPLGDDVFRDQVRDAIRAAGADPAPADTEVSAFAGRCHYLPGDYRDPTLYRALGTRLAALAAQFQTGGNILFYLATPSDLHLPIAGNLAAAGLLDQATGNGWRRLVIEKPFGHDLASARELDAGLHRVLSEKQIYRIDHYLGKDTVQNIFFLRFANLIFESLWNRQYIDHVQITVAESIGTGHRAGYFDHTGLLRDMFQNHMLQILALIAMEPPTSFDAGPIMDEKLKILRCLRPFDTPEQIRTRLVRGQYAAATPVAGAALAAYREEHGVAADSPTETYVAGTFLVDNWRWRGVPFYLRSGKRLAKRISEAVIVFKPVPFSLFAPLAAEDLTRNVLVLNIQPDEGMELTVQAKRPGPKLCMSALTMDVKYRDVFDAQPPDAYERLLLDAMLGDQTLFLRSDLIETAWGLFDPVQNYWHTADAAESAPLHMYPAGSWGPGAGDRLLESSGHFWHET